MIHYTLPEIILQICYILEKLQIWKCNKRNVRFEYVSFKKEQAFSCTIKYEALQYQIFTEE